MSRDSHLQAEVTTSAPTANETELDELVERWHDGEGGDLPLHEFLGMSWEEYARWVQDPALAPGKKS